MKLTFTLILSSLIVSSSLAQEKKEEPPKKGVWKKGDPTGIEKPAIDEKKKADAVSGLNIVEEDYVPPVDVMTFLDSGNYNLSGQGLTFRLEYFNPRDPNFKNAVCYMEDKATGIEFWGLGEPKEHPQGHGLVFHFSNGLFITRHPGNDSVLSQFPASVFQPKELLFQIKDDKLSSVLVKRNTVNEWRRLSLDKSPLPKTKVNIETPAKK